MTLSLFELYGCICCIKIQLFQSNMTEYFDYVSDSEYPEIISGSYSDSELVFENMSGSESETEYNSDSNFSEDEVSNSEEEIAKDETEEIKEEDSKEIYMQLLNINIHRKFGPYDNIIHALNILNINSSEELATRLFCKISDSYYNGTKDVLSVLIDRGAKASKGSFKMLYQAITSNGDFEFVKYLVENGASVNSRAYAIYRLLEESNLQVVQFRGEKIIKYLIDVGTPVILYTEYKDMKDIENGSLERLKDLEDGDYNYGWDSYISQCSVSIDNFDIIKNLIERIDSSRIDYGNIIEIGHPEIVKYIIEAKKNDVNCTFNKKRRDRVNWSHFCMYIENTEIADYIFNLIDTIYEDSEKDARRIKLSILDRAIDSIWHRGSFAYGKINMADWIMEQYDKMGEFNVWLIDNDLQEVSQLIYVQRKKGVSNRDIAANIMKLEKDIEYYDMHDIINSCISMGNFPLIEEILKLDCYKKYIDDPEHILYNLTDCISSVIRYINGQRVDEEFVGNVIIPNLKLVLKIKNPFPWLSKFLHDLSRCRSLLFLEFLHSIGLIFSSYIDIIFILAEFALIERNFVLLSFIHSKIDDICRGGNGDGGDVEDNRHDKGNLIEVFESGLMGRDKIQLVERGVYKDAMELLSIKYRDLYKEYKEYKEYEKDNKRG